MSRIIILVLFVATMIIPNLAFSAVLVNEVQVLPSGEKFVELFNNGSESVDLTGWVIKKKTESGTESTLVATSRLSGKSIPASGYFLIANETGYTGLGTLDASWPPSSTGIASNNAVFVYDSLSNLVDSLGWGSFSQCQNPCPASPESGLSLQRQSSSDFAVLSPTPGAPNEDSGGGGDTESTTSSGGGGSGGGSSTSSSSEEEKQTKVVKPKPIETYITAPKYAFIGTPFDIRVHSTGTSGEALYYGKYYINLGDGSFKEFSGAATFKHVFDYEGEYSVISEYYSSMYSIEKDAIAKHVVKVVPLGVSISRVGDRDFFIELTNNSSYEVDVSGWSLLSVSKSFKIPKNTLLGPKKKIILSPKITGFTTEDKNSLRLVALSGEEVYLFLVEPEKSSAPKETPKISTASAKSKIINTEKVVSSQEILDQSDISASAGDAVDSNQNNNFIFYIFGLFLLIVSGLVYFLRANLGEKNIADEFEMLDE